MIKNYTLNDIVSSPLKNKLIKYYNHDQKFISLIGSFFITTDRFLPICSDSFCTSTDLFGFYEDIKYEHLLTNEFHEKILNQNKEIQTIQNSFILGSTGNYYHDLIDCYSRIFSYNKNLSLNKNIDKIIISEINIKNILEEILSILDIKIPVFCLKKDKIYKFENSIITANRNIYKIIKLYRKFFASNQIKPSKNLFISKRDSFNRNIINEKDLLNFLKNYNFEIQTLSKKSFTEQKELFASSKFIVTMHGAALTNLLFAPSGSTIIEITGDFMKRKNDWFSKKNSTEFNNFTRSMYNVLASECGIEHYYYFSKVLFPNNHKIKYEFEKFTLSNLFVDIDIFRKFFQKTFRQNFKPNKVTL